jgi:hypothetical protein
VRRPLLLCRRSGNSERCWQANTDDRGDTAATMAACIRATERRPLLVAAARGWTERRRPSVGGCRSKRRVGIKSVKTRTAGLLAEGKGTHLGPPTRFSMERGPLDAGRSREAGSVPCRPRRDESRGESGTTDWLLSLYRCRAVRAGHEDRVRSAACRQHRRQLFGPLQGAAPSTGCERLRSRVEDRATDNRTSRLHRWSAPSHLPDLGQLGPFRKPQAQEVVD